MLVYLQNKASPWTSGHIAVMLFGLPSDLGVQVLLYLPSAQKRYKLLAVSPDLRRCLQPLRPFADALSDPQRRETVVGESYCSSEFESTTQHQHQRCVEYHQVAFWWLRREAVASLSCELVKRGPTAIIPPQSGFSNTAARCVIDVGSHQSLRVPLVAVSASLRLLEICVNGVQFQSVPPLVKLLALCGSALPRLNELVLSGFRFVPRGSLVEALTLQPVGSFPSLVVLRLIQCGLSWAAGDVESCIEWAYRRSVCDGTVTPLRILDVSRNDDLAVCDAPCGVSRFVSGPLCSLVRCSNTDDITSSRRWTLIPAALEVTDAEFQYDSTTIKLLSTLSETAARAGGHMRWLTVDADVSSTRGVQCLRISFDTSHVHSLNLSHSRLDDIGLQFISRLPQLEQLVIVDTSVTFAVSCFDESIPLCARFPQLRVLVASWCFHITNDGCDAIGKIFGARPAVSGLAYLDISGCTAVTDSGLMSGVCRVVSSSLVELYLHDVTMGDDGFDALMLAASNGPLDALGATSTPVSPGMIAKHWNRLKTMRSVCLDHPICTCS